MFPAERLLAALILPPAGPLLVLVAGIVLWRRMPRLARSCLALAAAALWALATPAIADRLLAMQETAPPLSPAQIAKSQDIAQAIIVLGAGKYDGAPEYGGDTVGAATLERLRYAARLQKLSGLPILVSGGAPQGGTAEAEVMRVALEEDFGAKATWVEDRSRNTRENARLSADMLRAAGVRRVLLVSHAWHLPRAARHFAEHGVEAVAAPTAFTADSGEPAFVPSARALLRSRIALKEMAAGL